MAVFFPESIDTAAVFFMSLPFFGSEFAVIETTEGSEVTKEMKELEKNNNLTQTLHWSGSGS